MTELQFGTAKTRVKRGARWLDENFPGWEKRINIKTLDMFDGDKCICGKVFKRRTRIFYNGYEYANRTFFSEANDWITVIVKIEPVQSNSYNYKERAGLVSRALGFNINILDGLAGITYETLQVEWIKLLEKRASAKVEMAHNVWRQETKRERRRRERRARKAGGDSVRSGGSG